ncbi:MAG: M23 family metallopeptidase [Aliarcobacter sp.]|jgi:murein DD-endopeptidase MepM/ murein hydrolase activator NlpD|nr:M23 family metallopeptidase [Aliarcobacter sp.]
MLFSSMFERNAPKIKVQNEIYWNFQKPINVTISDNIKIKSYEMVFVDGDKKIKLDTKVIKEENGAIDLEVLPPQFDEFYKPKEGSLRIEAFDTSSWNFFKGNQSVSNSKIIIDKKSPVANVITNSYLLRQGGSGIIIVEILDENLKDYYVSFNDEELFELFPFQKKNFYMSIITWPIDIKEFKRVNVVAIDLAGNKTETKVPFYIKSFKEKIDDIKISDEFVNSVSKHVLENSNMNVPSSIVETFVKTNKELREKNLQTIKEVVKKNLPNAADNPFDVKPFIRLPNAATFAQFGERRHYFYNEQKIDEAWHLGMDWASVKRADVLISNPGKVIFKDYLGIYGDTVIVDHGYGLGTLYAHTSSIRVNVDDNVVAGQHIANTGSTGAVFGDHLHFGVLVQGIEVNPNEWLDFTWMKTNVTKTINDAMKVINAK